MARKLPRISERWVYGEEVPQGCVQLDTAAWFAWLEAPSTAGFSYPIFDPRCGYIVGFMTVRKEQRQRGGSYWVVFRRQGARVRKLYLGRSATVTHERLEMIATQLRNTPSAKGGG
jgi:hypothetical protein